MNDDNKKLPDRMPRVGYKTRLRIKLPGFPQFIERHSKNISEGGMFIAMKDPKPVGTTVQFEFVEKEQSTIIKGEGVVKWVRKVDPDQKKVPGMGIQFTKLTKESLALIKRIVELKTKQPEEPQQTEEKRPKQDAPDIANMIEEAKSADTEKLGGVKTKGFFKEEVDVPADEPSKKKAGRIPVIGIDLGTTNSCVAFVKEDKPTVIQSSKGYRTLPSIVAHPGDGKVLIGQDAKPYFLTNPELTVYGSKRMLGRKYRSKVIEELKPHFRYRIKEGDRGDVVVNMEGKDVPLPVISSLILKELKGVAEDHFKQPVRSAVITVPAHYSNRQRECVKEAGLLAGLEVKRIVNEPTAAALAYGLNKGLSEKILIYDLGGGTFDVSIMEISNNVFEVMATGGDPFLGGIDFDNRILSHVIGKFKEKTGIDLQKHKEAIQRVKEAAEKAKIDLSLKSQTVISIPHIVSDGDKKHDLVVEMTRMDLEAITADLVNKTIQITREVLDAKGIKSRDLNEIILVGGQTRMPLVTETLKRIFGKTPKKGVHPDEVVALGAALLADSFDKIDSVVLLDSLSVPIGVGLPGGKFKEIIPRNTRIPFQKTFQITTTKDEQTSVDIDIYQGEEAMLENCEYLGTFVVDNIPKAQKGASRIILEFNLDPECILHLKATESLSKQVVETEMVVRETPQCVREQFEKEKVG